jgi:putative transposase
MQAEIIALRHQLTVLQRNQKPRRPALNRGDRCLWVWLSRVWSAWRSTLIIVKPETVIGWHHQGLPVVVDLEDSSRSIGTPSCSEGDS